MNNFSYFSTVRTMFNNDLREGLKQARSVLGVNKAMIMTDPGVAALPIWKEMQEAMDEIGFAYETYTEVKPNPTDVTMEAAADALKATDCDIVIGFGGGSAIDTAKMNMEILSEQREIEKNYRAIGEWFVSEFQGEVPDAVKDVVAAVNASKEKIAQLEAAKRKEETQDEEPQAESGDAKTCSVCGTVSDSNFCPHCGAPMGK